MSRNRGFSLVTVLVASAIAGIVSVIIAEILRQQFFGVQAAHIQISRDQVFSHLGRLAGDPTSLSLSAALPGNDAFKACVVGSNPAGCTDGANQDFQLVDTQAIVAAGTSANPQYYDINGVPCAKPATPDPKCPLQAFTTFQAVCPVGTSPCTQAVSVIVSFNLQQDPGVKLSAGPALKKMTNSISSNLPLNGSTIPRGVIVMWSGTLATVPTGWALCDGSNGTPNLSDRFIKSPAAGVNPGNTGGASTITLSVAQIPSMTVPAQTVSGTTSSTGDHVHDIYGNGNTATGGYWDVWFQGNLGGAYFRSGLTAPAGAHTHTFSGSTAPTTVGGSSAPIDIRPSYYELAFIMKL